ncbi:hypothetical protein TREMEDRAFT_44556 [Tremella mesenterica DSM 1558]|uniref:uncharacterized protein n=1 Tax=Tremella mesenterica (strain ATCC 24925 / CBS 8224 / DSM 1558 / NBRC 9311 / NRRL Y-6157 / RJB 2259-6 / UBC 559-6) TaxID=578456 RepID=UPI0003F49C65|nr:uncharacterized protein TREMEDRAFT_44556 [Tremella mesenterica DSM 1558]EIW68749.1 hypothetical protein TREMEDRAFT_44556 [Tremella mesenterica DSM 1558]
MSTLYPGGALIAVGLAGHGYRKGSLSPSGAIAALLVGYGHLANPLKLFGTTMIVFYLLGSRATKVKAAYKATLEDGPDPTKPGGNRDAIQVLSNSLPSLLAALAYRFYVSQNIFRTGPISSNGLSRSLIFFALGHFSNCLADTLASELGILSSSPPRHILTLQSVPKGTNGGVSPLGLGVSALGGLVMGLTMVVDLLIEDPMSRNDYGWASELLVFGILAGLAGSVLDSILGATLQQTLFSEKDHKILTDLSTRRSGEDIKPIGFGLNILSNSGVNFVCGWVLASVGWWYGSRV